MRAYFTRTLKDPVSQPGLWATVISVGLLERVPLANTFETFVNCTLLQHHCPDVSIIHPWQLSILADIIPDDLANHTARTTDNLGANALHYCTFMNKIREVSRRAETNLPSDFMEMLATRDNQGRDIFAFGIMSEDIDCAIWCRGALGVRVPLAPWYSFLPLSSDPLHTMNPSALFSAAIKTASTTMIDFLIDDEFMRNYYDTRTKLTKQSLSFTRDNSPASTHHLRCLFLNYAWFITPLCSDHTYSFDIKSLLITLFSEFLADRENKYKYYDFVGSFGPELERMFHDYKTEEIPLTVKLVNEFLALGRLIVLVKKYDFIRDVDYEAISVMLYRAPPMPTIFLDPAALFIDSSGPVGKVPNDKDVDWSGFCERAIQLSDPRINPHPLLKRFLEKISKTTTFIEFKPPSEYSGPQN